MGSGDDRGFRARRAFRLMRRAHDSAAELPDSSEPSAGAPSGAADYLREAHEALLAEIEERKRCEAELTEERELTRALIHSSPAGLLLMDRQGQVRDCNERCAELLHVPRGALIGQSALSLTMDMALRAALTRALVGFSTEQDGTLAGRPDVPAAFVRASFVAIRNGGGELLGAVGFLTDLSRSQDEASLNARLLALVKSAEDGAMGLTPEGLVASWSPRAEAILGPRSGEAIGKPFWSAVAWDDLGQIRGLVEAACGGSESRGDVRWRAADAQRHGARLTLAPVVGAGGAVLGVVVWVREEAGSGSRAPETERLAVPRAIRWEPRQAAAPGEPPVTSAAPPEPGPAVSPPTPPEPVEEPAPSSDDPREPEPVTEAEPDVVPQPPPQPEPPQPRRVTDDELEAQLSHHDGLLRAEAAVGLFLRGRGTRGLPVLVECLTSPDAHVRGYAAGALGRMGAAAEPALPTLVTRLRDPDPWTRTYVCTALGRLAAAASAAVPDLLERLGDDDPLVRGCALEALGRIGDPPESAAEAVSRLVDSPHAEVRQAAQAMLRRLGGTPNVDRGTTRPAIGGADPRS